MSESRIPEFTTKYDLNETVVGVLQEIEKVSPQPLTDRPRTPTVRFGTVDNPAPQLQLIDNRIRIVMGGRFIEMNRGDSGETFRCGPCMIDFKAVMKERRAAIDYLFDRDSLVAHQGSAWED